MRIRLALGLVAVTACSVPEDPAPGAPIDAAAGLDVDAGPGPDAGRDAAGDGGPADAGIDAAADTTPPALVAIVPAPGSEVWLHAPIRLVFDEPLVMASASSVTARVDGTAISAQMSFEPPATLVIELAAAARGTGTLELDITAILEDLAGNAGTAAVIETWSVPPWHAPPIDRGVAVIPPSIHADDAGRVLAGWTVGGAGARRVVVAELAGASWTALGSPLGTGDVGPVSIARDADGAPLVAWIDGGVAHVARWAELGWTELASPGSGTHVAVASPPSGAPIAAVFGAGVSVYALDGSTWSAIGPPLAPPAAIAGEPTLAAPSSGTAVVGWVDAGAQLRVYRNAGTWQAFSPIAVSAGARASIAARSTTVAVAWERWAGSWAVLAAVASGGATTFTPLGRPLDIDISGDARAPAIALDPGGAPLVAWTELVETRYRGGLARWSGSAWTLVGGVTWLPSALSPPAGARLALAGSVAIAATTAAGDIHVARLNGPRTPALGLTARAALAGCAFDPAAPPQLLSQTGCFTIPAAGRPVPHAGLVPYDLVAELWTDGARKRRWLALPANQSLSLAGNGAFAAPVGTFVIKEFALETTPGNPATRRAIETRFLVNGALGWQGFSYRWNTAGTDATLLADAATTGSWQLDDGTSHVHVYPSRAHCRSCHDASRGPLLGLRPEQLARWFDYGGVIADQLPTLAALDITPSTSAPAFTSPHDPTATVEQRMRGYMAANCSHCHNPQYLDIKDLRYSTPLANTRLCEAIVPGSAGQSLVYQLVTSRPGMPPLGTAMVDPLAADLLGTWISSMSSCP